MSLNAETIWQKTCQSLKKQLNPDVYSRWIEVIKPGEIDSDKLVLSVSNDFYQSWLEEHYLPLINKTILDISGQQLSVKFKVNQKILKSNSTTNHTHVFNKQNCTKNTRSRSNTHCMSLNSKYTFESFVVGPSNDFAHASSLAVAQAPGKAYNPLFIYGDVGLGKTHLMQAIGQYFSTAQPTARVCYMSCEALMNEYINSLQNRSIYQFRKKYRKTDILLIDDIHFLAKKNALQEEFFHTFNELFNARKQIVMTSDRPAAEISGLEKRLVSRFEWGLVTELASPDFETRLAILRSKQKSMNIVLPEDVITFIASHIQSNIRRLEGALIRVSSYSSLYKKTVTLELVKQILHVILEQEKTEPLTINVIQRHVADFYDIRMSDMSSKDRSRGVALPRQVAMYICRTMTTTSLPEIGYAFSKTHATVLHACRLISKKQSLNPDLKHVITKLSEQLTATNA